MKYLDEFDKIAQQILDDVASAHAEMIAADIPWLASVPATQKSILLNDAADRIAAAIRTAVADETERCAGITDNFVMINGRDAMVAEHIATAIRARQPAAPTALATLHASYAKLSDADQESFIRTYCHGCGGNRPCHCLNDE